MKLKKLLCSFIPVLLILGAVPFASSASTYSNKKGSVKVVCGKYKKTFKAKNCGKNFSRALNKALETAGKKATDKKKAVVTISKGKYTLDRTIRVYSNTELVAKGVTVKSSRNQLRNNFDKNKTSGKGYSGARNITITGGTWNANISYSKASKVDDKSESFSTFRFAHCKNVTVRNATFKNNYNSHDIELGGVDGVNIYKCKFSNDKDMNKFDLSGGIEAIQVDVCHKVAMLNFPTYDYTVTKNVKIHDNTFTNKYRAVGSHHAVPGNTYDNIKVYSNKMDNIGGIAINAMYWTNSAVYNNTLNNVGSGIDFVAFGDHNMYNEKKLSYSTIVEGLKKSKTYIYGNTVKVRSSSNKITFRFGIRARGTDCLTVAKDNKNVDKGIYRLYNAHLGVNTSGKSAPNKISGCFNAGVSFVYATDSEMAYNSVDMNGCTYNSVYGLFVSECENAVVHDNKSTVTNGETKIPRSGATIRGGINTEFRNNTVNVTDYGIQHIYGADKVNIHDNDITSSRLNCVYYSGQADPTPDVTKSVTVTNNKLSSPDTEPNKAAIRFYFTNIELNAYSNGDVLYSVKGTAENTGINLFSPAVSEPEIRTDGQVPTLEWLCNEPADVYRIYKLTDEGEELVAEVGDCVFEGPFESGERFRIVPVYYNYTATLLGEAATIEV